jgi:hypothetical protein
VAGWIGSRTNTSPTADECQQGGFTDVTRQ